MCVRREGCKKTFPRVYSQHTHKKTKKKMKKKNDKNDRKIKKKQKQIRFSLVFSKNKKHVIACFVCMCV